jgi:hypothetical protein
MKGCLRFIGVFTVVFFVLACLPVIPVRTAPVVPRPIYTLKVVSLVGMFGGFFRVGSSQRWEWYTCAAIPALIGISLAISVYVSKKLGGSSENGSLQQRG